MHFVVRKKYQQKTLKGFSIGEVLLAAFVLTSGLLATSALMSTSLHNSFETRDAIIATQLSQEGIELVRNFRDNDFAAEENGFSNNFLFHNGLGNKRCRLDYTDNDPSDLSNLTCTNTAPSSFGSGASRYTLHYTNVFVPYEHTGSSAERFSRYIYIDYDRNTVSEPGDDTALVKSYVYWGAVLDFPNPDNTTFSDCTIKNRCVFTEVTLTSWAN